MNSSLAAGACSAPVFFLGKPCNKCKKRTTDWRVVE